MQPVLIFVGESPPPKAPTGFKPFDCDSGTRLATKAIGLVGRAPLLTHTFRVNIFDEPGVGVLKDRPWHTPSACESAERIIKDNPSTADAPRVYVALGNKVKAAFGHKDLPAYSWVADKWRERWSIPHHVIACPHPSGQNTSLNTAATQATARRLLIPELIVGSGLKPWHWNLEDQRVLADLGAALCPTDPVLGAAAACSISDLAKSGKDGEEHRSITLQPFVELMQGAHGGVEYLLNSWSADRTRRRDLRARMKAIKSSGLFDDYPPEVLRATMGRYVSLGAL